eukprot:TRINITY_DN17589_c0_g1_i1.p1 TRINITY_DN17589_c0_g1~~TRINITY_DN17589_c0_g1_i1.p1  ORF type:complete len:981 (+),score=118.80 TRINITY_DN17589_c0_g1_i1:979-3921(+)
MSCTGFNLTLKPRAQHTSAFSLDANPPVIMPFLEISGFRCAGIAARKAYVSLGFGGFRRQTQLAARSEASEQYQWNESVQFPITERSDATLQVTVYEPDMFGDRHYGSAKVPWLATVATGPGCAHEGQWELSGVNTVAGRSHLVATLRIVDGAIPAALLRDVVPVAPTRPTDPASPAEHAEGIGLGDILQGKEKVALHASQPKPDEPLRRPSVPSPAKAHDDRPEMQDAPRLVLRDSDHAVPKVIHGTRIVYEEGIASQPSSGTATTSAERTDVASATATATVAESPPRSGRRAHDASPMKQYEASSSAESSSEVQVQAQLQIQQGNAEPESTALFSQGRGQQWSPYGDVPSQATCRPSSATQEQCDTRGEAPSQPAENATPARPTQHVDVGSALPMAQPGPNSVDVRKAELGRTANAEAPSASGSSTLPIWLQESTPAAPNSTPTRPPGSLTPIGLFGHPPKRGSLPPIGAVPSGAPGTDTVSPPRQTVPTEDDFHRGAEPNASLRATSDSVDSSRPVSASGRRCQRPLGSSAMELASGSSDAVRDFLVANKLGQYADVLVNAGFDTLSLLGQITTTTMTELGIRPAHQRALSAALDARGRGAPPTGPGGPSHAGSSTVNAFGTPVGYTALGTPVATPVHVAAPANQPAATGIPIAVTVGTVVGTVVGVAASTASQGELVTATSFWDLARNEAAVSAIDAAPAPETGKVATDAEMIVPDLVFQPAQPQAAAICAGDILPGDTPDMPMRYTCIAPHPLPAHTDERPDLYYEHVDKRRVEESQRRAQEVMAKEPEAGLAGKLGHFVSVVGRTVDSAVTKSLSVGERKIRGLIDSRYQQLYNQHFPSGGPLLAAFDCKALDGRGYPHPGVLFITDLGLDFSVTKPTAPFQFRSRIPFAEVVSVQKAVVFGMPALQLFTRRNTFHQILGFRDISGEVFKHLTKTAEGAAFDRVYNYLDHAWRAAVTVPCVGVHYAPLIFVFAQ